MDALLIPRSQGRPGDIIISPWSHQAMGTQLVVAAQANLVSAQWIAANRVLFYPFTVPEPVTLTKAFFGGTNTASGNVDIGLYDVSYNLLVSSGSTAYGALGGSMIQVINTTDLTIGRGTYYAAMVGDTAGAGATFLAMAPSAAILQGFGWLQQSSVTLPLSSNANPATPAAMASAFLPLFGFQGYRTAGP